MIKTNQVAIGSCNLIDQIDKFIINAQVIKVLHDRLLNFLHVSSSGLMKTLSLMLNMLRLIVVSYKLLARAFLYLFFLKFAMIVFGNSAAKAANIEIIDVGNSLPLISITGEIIAGDARIFTEKTKQLKRGLVVLSSPGGITRDALDIGSQIRLREFSTTVDDVCASACGLIWLSGTHLYLNNGAKLGFHAAYNAVGDENNESGVANAEIGAYLTYLGYSLAVVQFVTLAPPNEIRWLSRNDAERLGIKLQPAPPVDVSTDVPKYQLQASTDVIRKQISQIASIASHLAIILECESIYGINISAIKAEHKNLMNAGVSFNDKRFYDFLSDELRQRGAEIKRDGLERFCLNEKLLFNTSIGKKIFIP
jgi:hypothetical protein